MGRSAIYIWLIIALLLPGTACEKDRDFNSDFPSRAILGSGPYQGSYWPTDGWKSCAPEEVGMDSELLRKMNEDMVLQMRLHIDVHSVIVIRKGYIVSEQYYADEYSSDSLHYVFSCTKSVTSAALGIASDRGLLPSLDIPIIDFFPEYQVKNPDGKDAITLEHALTMTDGFEWYELQYLYSDDRNTFRQWRNSDGSIQFILDQPLLTTPGESFNYNSGISHLLSIILQKQTGMRLDSFAAQEIFHPLGISDYYWSVNQEGAARGYSGLYLRPRDLAKFGLLYLNGGLWEDRQLISESWVTESTSKHILRGDIPGMYYGYQWWVHEDGLIAAVGFGGQILMLIPEYDLIVLFNNYHNEADGFQMETPWRLLDTFIIPAIVK
jgi:CubicO group peptidase (beta-lactamase class C family)